MGRGGVSTPTPKPMPEKTPKPHERVGEVAPTLLKPELLHAKWNLYVPQWHVSTKEVVMAPAQRQIRATLQEMRDAGPNTF